jgi:sulfhydrogenase subunit delta
MHYHISESGIIEEVLFIFPMDKKLKVGWFSFSCCEDSSIMFTELLNDRWEQWSKLLDFRHARILKSNNELSDIDVSFVEGAIANKKDREELEKIRANSRKIVAIGSCACTGIPSSQRNDFSPDCKQAIQYLLDRYGYETEVHPLKDIIKVDDEVPGCPMVEPVFLKVVDKYLKEFGITPNS